MEAIMTVDIAPVPNRIAQRFSLEATRPTADEVARLDDTVPPGTMVYLTAVPSQSAAELAAAAARLRRAGLEPVAHIAARRLASVEQTARPAERLARRGRRAPAAGDRRRHR